MNDLKIKEVNFNKVCDWLSSYPEQFNCEKIKEIKDKDTQFLARVELKSKHTGLPFEIKFKKELPDSFFITAHTFLDDDLKKSIDALRKKEQQQIYMDLRIWIYPLNIQFDMDFPRMSFFKLIFYENLSKQLFFDSINNLSHAINLSTIRFQMEHNKMFPNDDNESGT